MCSASCRAVGTQAIPPSNQPTFSVGCRSRMPEKTYLANCSRNESTLTIMPTTTLLCWHGVFGRRLADVVADGHAGRLDLVPYRVHLGAAVVVDVAVVVLARVERQQERLQAQRLQFFEGASGALRIPPVDQADAMEMAVAALLQIGDVLVVDAEHPLAQGLVRVVEQREHGVGEREFLVDTVFGELGVCGHRCCSTPHLPGRRTA